MDLKTVVRSRWMHYAPQYWWGDPLDVRFELCERVARIKHARILDIGCNAGIVLLCADSSNTRFGFDTNADAIAIARRIARDAGEKVVFSVKDAFLAKLPAHSFDIIILSHVLPGYDYPSSQNRASFIRSVSKYLKPGGTILLTTPNKAHPYYRKGFKMSRAELKQLFPKEQFSVSVLEWNPFPMVAGHVLRFVPGMHSILRLLAPRTQHGVAFLIEAKYKQ